MRWPKTAAGKIGEGKHKLKQMELHWADIDREIEMLEKVVEGMETEMRYELDLVLHCGDVEIMRRARQRCVPQAPFSEAEERALRDIRELAASAIAGYAANVGPVPAYDRPINPLSDTIRLPLSRRLAGLSASRHRWPIVRVLAWAYVFFVILIGVTSGHMCTLIVLTLHSY
jgi:hypothetical protein